MFLKLEFGFSPVAVVQQYNRQVTHITHKHNKNTTVNDTTTANTYTIHPAKTNKTKTTENTKKHLLNHQFSLFTHFTSLHSTSRTPLYLTRFTRHFIF
jgi:hypothetical protein